MLAEGEVSGIALVGAVGHGVGVRQQVHAHIVAGEVLARRVAAFAQLDGAGGVGQDGTVDDDPHPARMRVQGDARLGGLSHGGSLCVFSNILFT